MITRTRASWILLSLFVVVGVIAAACGEAATPTPAPSTPEAMMEETPAAMPEATDEPETMEPTPTAMDDEPMEEAPSQVMTAEGEMPQCTVEGETPLPGGTLRVTSYEPASYDAMGALDPYGGAATQSFTHLTLTQADFCDWRNTADYTVYPYLAESWEVSDDGTVFTFHIRDGVEWEDRPPVNGREVTAHDVAFSYNRVLESSQIKGSLGPLESVEAVDDKTVVFTLSTPFPAFLPHTANSYFPIYAPEVLEEFGGYDSPESNIGAGPWMLLEHEPGVKQVFVRNDNYFRGANGITGEELPYIDRVEALFITDDVTKLAMYRGHDIDVGPAFYYWGWWSGDNDVYESLKSTDPELALDFRSFSDTAFPLWRMQPKIDRPPFDNEKLRQAVSRVIDRTFTPWAGTWGVVEAREMNFDHPWFLPWDQLTDLGKANYPRDAAGNPIRDIESARALVDEAKAEMGLGPDDTIDAGTIYTHNQADYFAGLTELIKAWLADIGIESEIVVLDITEWNTSIAIPPYEWCCIQFSYGHAELDPDGYFYRNFHPDGDDNRGGVNDPTLTAMIEAQRVEQDSEARKQIIYDLQEYLAEKQYEWRMPNFLAQNIYPPWLKNVGAQKGTLVPNQGFAFTWAWMAEDAPTRQ